MGHFAPTHFAANYWREQTKSGREINAAIVNTTSTSGLFSNPGQANYDAAKTGIATLTQVAAKELVRYGVRANAIAPAARTRLTLSTPGLDDDMATPGDGGFDTMNPANVSPLVAYLSTADCTITGETFVVFGGVVQRVQTAGPSPSWPGAPNSGPSGSVASPHPCAWSSSPPPCARDARAMCMREPRPWLPRVESCAVQDSHA
jgi:hypothetical protein